MSLVSLSPPLIVFYLSVHEPHTYPTESYYFLTTTTSSSYFSSFIFFLATSLLSFTKAMNKFKKSQVIVLFVLVLLLVITPLLPSSVKPTYLYFICNFLIIALGAEAGLLSVFSRPLEDTKQYVSVTQKPVMAPEVIPEKREVFSTTGESDVSEHVDKFASEKLQKCPSMPSLFFIGDGESDAEGMDEEPEVEDEIEGVNGQELFSKAEAFIGNFYKQLKMQREES